MFVGHLLDRPVYNEVKKAEKSVWLSLDDRKRVVKVGF